MPVPSTRHYSKPTQLNNTYSCLQLFTRRTTPRITPPWHDHSAASQTVKPHQSMGEPESQKDSRSQDHPPTLNLDPRRARSDLEFGGPRLAGGSLSTNGIAPTSKPIRRIRQYGEGSCEKREERSRSKETLEEMTRTDDLDRDFGNSVFCQLLKSDAF